MKNLILLLSLFAFSVTFTSCDKEDEPQPLTQTVDNPDTPTGEDENTIAGWILKSGGTDSLTFGEFVNLIFIDLISFPKVIELQATIDSLEEVCANIPPKLTRIENYAILYKGVHAMGEVIITDNTWTFTTYKYNNGIEQIQSSVTKTINGTTSTITSTSGLEYVDYWSWGECAATVYHYE